MRKFCWKKYDWQIGSFENLERFSCLLLIVVMLILQTQCSVNTIDSMSICLKNVGVKILVFMFHKPVLTFSVYPACFQTKIMFVHSQIQQQWVLPQFWWNCMKLIAKLNIWKFFYLLLCVFFLLMHGIGCIIWLWHSLSLPDNYLGTKLIDSLIELATWNMWLCLWSQASIYYLV